MEQPLSAELENSDECGINISAPATLPRHLLGFCNRKLWRTPEIQNLQYIKLFPLPL